MSVCPRNRRNYHVGCNLLLAINRVRPAKIEQQIWVADIKDIVLRIPFSHTLTYGVIDYLGDVKASAGGTRPAGRISIARRGNSINERLIPEGELRRIKRQSFYQQLVYVTLPSITAYMNLSV